MQARESYNDFIYRKTGINPEAVINRENFMTFSALFASALLARCIVDATFSVTLRSRQSGGADASRTYSYSTVDD